MEKIALLVDRNLEDAEARRNKVLKTINNATVLVFIEEDISKCDLQKVIELNGVLIIIADHGNCDVMWDKDKKPVTSHTTNPVPIWLVSEKYKDVKLNNGKLCNVAPTVLKLLNLDIPQSMQQPLF